MKAILSTSNTETFYQLCQKVTNGHILQIIFRQILLISERLEKVSKS